jgi:hypothetical protein
MDVPIKQVPRPSSSPEQQGNDAPYVIQRNTLTLYLSFAAILLSCASAAVNLFTFYAAGQQKALNEADQILLKAQANRVLAETNAKPDSHPQLSKELASLYSNLIYRPAPEVPLTVYERAAFGLVVEAYALPLTEVLQKRMEAQARFVNLGYKVPWGLSRCYADPFGHDCPADKELGNDAPNSPWLKSGVPAENN